MLGTHPVWTYRSQMTIFADSRDPMTIFADSREPIFNSKDPNRVPETPWKKPGQSHYCLVQIPALTFKQL